MTTIDDIRRANIRALIAEAKSLRRAADIVGTSESQLSQWANGSADSKTGKPRGMRSDSARVIEKKFGKDRGWLDAPHEEEISDEVSIPQFKTGGAMGNGLVLHDQPGVIQGWRVSPDWIQKNVKNASSARNLCIVTGFGDSMRPLYNPGDPLIVDRGVTVVEIDAVYFFRVGNEGFIKRLQRVPGEGLVALSENKAYRDWVVRDDMDFEVFGRVLKIWRGEDY